MPGETDCWYTPRNCSVYLKGHGHGILFQGRTKMPLNNESVLVTRTSYGELKLQCIESKPLYLKGYIFQDDTLQLRKKEIIHLDAAAQYEQIKIFSESIMDGDFTQLPNLKQIMNGVAADNTQEDNLPITSKKIDPRLIHINRYIRGNFHRPISLQILGDLVNSNQVYLSNTYTKVFQISPIYYLNQLRIKRAKEMLLSTDDPIRDIAKIVGYSSNSHFSAIFKRYTSMTPAEFRKMESTSFET